MQAVRGRVGVVGRVADDLPAVSGVVATVTPDQLAVLKAQPDLVVTPDVSVSVADASMGSATRAPAAVFPQTTGASQLWANGIDGRGITVAVGSAGATAVGTAMAAATTVAEVTAGGKRTNGVCLRRASWRPT